LINNYCIDTNFFIAAFGENPNDYERFNKILRKLKIKVFISDYVNKEMRWYMRRVIEPLVITREINPTKLKKFEVESQQKVKIKLPQTPDMSVILLAKQESCTIVSSDMRLVEVSRELKIEAMWNSAFLTLLLDKINSDMDINFLKKIHERLLSEEITYSVKSQERYDPVDRIQKIIDSAIEVVKKQGEGSIHTKVTDEVVIEHKFPEYIELKAFTKVVRTDISEYVKLLELGQYRLLNKELDLCIKQLLDLSTEVRMQNVNENDPVYREALTTLAHILLLSSTIAIGDQRLNDAISIVDQLLLILLENDEVEERLDIEVHFQRMTLFFLTEQLQRLKIYFTPSFIELCQKRNRNDIIQLHRIMGIIAAVLSNKLAEKDAIARDFSEIQFIIQLGVQFISVNKFSNAWLLLEQATYLSINSNMSDLVNNIFDVLFPLSCINDENFNPEIDLLLSSISEKLNKKEFKELEKSVKIEEKVSDEFITSRAINTSNLPVELQGFHDVISAHEIDFKKIGKCVFIRVINKRTKHILGIVDPTLSIDENLSVGSSLMILEGKVRVTLPTKTMKEKRNINLLLIANPKGLRFIVKRAGQIIVAQSRISDYDL